MCRAPVYSIASRTKQFGVREDVFAWIAFSSLEGQRQPSRETPSSKAFSTTSSPGSFGLPSLDLSRFFNVTQTNTSNVAKTSLRLLAAKRYLHKMRNALKNRSNLKRRSKMTSVQPRPATCRLFRISMAREQDENAWKSLWHLMLQQFRNSGTECRAYPKFGRNERAVSNYKPVHKQQYCP